LVDALDRDGVLRGNRGHRFDALDPRFVQDLRASNDFHILLMCPTEAGQLR
jgi:hypothetical protein